MKTRILSAIVGIAFAAGLLILGSYFSIVIDLSLSLIASMCLYEGLSAKGLNKKFSIVIPCVAFTFLMCMFHSVNLAAPILVFAVILILFMAMIFNHEHLEFPDLAFAFTMTGLCTLGFLPIISLYDEFKNQVGIFYVVTALTTPWLADGGAYFGGTFLGKKKLCPKISPKKTVEGAVSGVIIGTGLTLLVGVIFEKFFFADSCYVNYILLAVFGLLGSLVSIVGDLSFSLIKRSCGIKDYGSLIPGHGGMLDRFDSVIFTAPLLMIFNMILPIIQIIG